jgi:anti-repressor protein
MSEPKLFNFQNHEIRIIDSNGEPWWVLNDVCKVLDIRVTDVTKRLEARWVDTINLTDSLNRMRETYIVKEPALYDLILQSRKTEASAFKIWVVEDVLPSIRKTGSYARAPKDYPSALRALADEVERNCQLETEIKQAAPKIEFYNAVADTKDLISIQEMAKELEVGSIKFFRFLYARKILINNSSPYQPYIDRGLLKVKEGVYETPKGETKVYFKVFVTGKGQTYLTNLWKNHNKVLVPALQG